MGGFTYLLYYARAFRRNFPFEAPAMYCSGCGKTNRFCECGEGGAAGRSRSKERREKEQRRGTRPAETDEPDFWDKIEDVLDKKVVKKLEPRFEKLEKGQEELVKRADTMEKRVEALEHGSSEGSGGPWKPAAIWIKNFCEYDARRTEGISRPQMMNILKTLKGHLDPDLQAHVGDFEMAGSLNQKVKVRIVPGYAHEIASVWKEKLGSKEEPPHPELKFNERVLFCHAERHPTEQKIYDKVGLTLSWLRSQVGGATVQCTWRPDFKLQVVTDMGNEVTEVGNIEADASIQWNESGLAKVGSGVTPAKATGMLVAFRSKRP